MVRASVSAPCSTMMQPCTATIGRSGCGPAAHIMQQMRRGPTVLWGVTLKCLPSSAPVALEEDDKLAIAPVRPRAVRQRPRQVPQRAVSITGLQAPRLRIAAVAWRHEPVGLPAVVALLGSVRAAPARPLVVERDAGHESEGQGGQQQAVRLAMDVHAGARPSEEGAETGCSCGADMPVTPCGHGCARRASRPPKRWAAD